MYRTHHSPRTTARPVHDQVAAAAPASPAGDGRIGARWPELAVLLVGQSLGSLAIAMTSTAAPTIGKDLHIGGGLLQLAVSGYGLAYTVLLMTGARLGAWGHRRLFLIGVAGFSVAGFVSGLAPVPAVLVAGQLIQGAGAAMLIPQVLSLVQLRFTGPARSRAVSLYSMTLGFGVAAGLLLGGVLMATDPLGLSWRAVFLVNVPLGVIVLWGGILRLPPDGPAERDALDRSGILVFIAGIGLLVVPLSFGPSSGWPPWTWASFGAGLVGLAAFTRIERGVARHGTRPLLDLAALRLPGVVTALVVVFVSMGGYGALVYTMSAYMQQGLHYGPLHASLVFCAYATGFGLANLTWSRLPERLHRRVAPTALTLLCLAESLLALTVRHGFAPGVAVPLLVGAGGGHGAGFGGVVSGLTARMPRRYASGASGLVNTTTQLGILIGIAGVGSVFLTGVSAAGPASGYARPMSAMLLALAACSALAVPCSLDTGRAGEIGTANQTTSTE
jgi:MFS family permease